MARPRLTRQLLLEDRVSAPDGSGGFETSWQVLGSLWAEMTAQAGRKDLVAGRKHSRVVYRILVRGMPVGSASRPRPEQRLRDGKRVFQILTVAEADPEGRFLEILVEEGVLP